MGLRKTFYDDLDVPFVLVCNVKNKNDATYTKDSADTNE